MEKVDFDLLDKYIMGYNVALFDIGLHLGVGGEDSELYKMRIDIFNLPPKVWDMTQDEAEDYVERLYVTALKKMAKIVK